MQLRLEMQEQQAVKLIARASLHEAIRSWPASMVVVSQPYVQGLMIDGLIVCRNFTETELAT